MQREGRVVPGYATGRDGAKIPRRDVPGAARHVAAESGFTLIELLVVVIIIGILAAVAIPTYLSQSEQAQAAAVQSDLRNAASSATACASDNGGSYATCTLASLDADYDFNPSSDVDFPAASVVATPTRWAAEARYAPNPANTTFHFDTDDGSQVRPGGL